ncbi:MAG TPA: hypothetical protein VH044_00455 [Polyangiaceae bacterium]|jgi:hypothetical protein|nr:hypothetical protein [Polyangiaceae bacterium]
MLRIGPGRAARTVRLACAVVLACGSVAGAASCSITGGGGGDNGGLGKGTFAYVCPPGVAGVPRPDAHCEANPGGAVIPDVAIGAPFGLSYDVPSVALRPAVSALVAPGPGGWALNQSGWVGFVAWSGSDVADYTHVRGRAIAKLVWETDPASLSLDAGDATPVNVAAIGEADDGTTLGGAIGCTFSTSDEGVLGVTADGGRTAQIEPLAAGEATLTATCAGVSLAAVLQVGVGDVAVDDGGDAPGAEGGGAPGSQGGVEGGGAVGGGA